MHTASKPYWRQYLPHACALVALPICYASALLFFDQQLLAVCAAALGVLATFLLCQTIKKRGQVSLAVTAFALPVLAAGACVTLLQLTPFVNRQRSFTALRTAGVSLQARPPDQSGEWLRNRSGIMLPVWIANAIGGECLSEIRSIHGALGAFQSVNFNHLDVSSLSSVTLKKDSNDTHITPELIRWLNACPKLRQVHFDCDYFSVLDGQALSELADASKCSVTIRNCESVEDLSSLSRVAVVYLVGKELPPHHARHFSLVPPLLRLVLEIEELSSDAISAFGLLGQQGDVAVRFRVAPEQVADFSKLGLFSLELKNLQSVPSHSTVEIQKLAATRYLRLSDSQLTFDQCMSLAALFQCENLTLSNITTIEQQRDSSVPVQPGEVLPPIASLTADQVDALWQLPNLTQICIFDGAWKYLDKPGLKPSE